MIDEKLTKKTEDLKGYDLDLVDALVAIGIEKEELDQKINVENLILMLEDFAIFDGRAYFKEGKITADLNIRSLFARYHIGDAIKILSPRDLKKILNEIIEYRKNTDNSKYNKVVYRLDLKEEGISFERDKIVVNQKLTVQEPSKKIQEEYSRLSDGTIESCKSLFMDKGLGNYVSLIVMLSLIKVFDKEIPNKKSLLHIVTASDAGKTHFMEMIAQYFPVATVKLKDVFTDRTKVDIEELSKSLVWFQDEHTILLNDFKELTGTIKINKAYAASAIHMSVPLVLMMSAEDVQDTISEQFQNRLLKVHAKTKSIKKSAEDKGVSLYHLNIVSNILVHDEVIKTLEKYMQMSGEEKATFLKKSEEDFSVLGHSIIEAVLAMIDDMWEDLIRMQNEHLHYDIINHKGKEYLYVRKRKFGKFIEWVIKNSEGDLSAKGLIYEAQTKKNPEEWGFEEKNTTWSGNKIRGLIREKPQNNGEKIILTMASGKVDRKIPPPPAPSWAATA